MDSNKDTVEEDVEQQTVLKEEGGEGTSKEEPEKTSTGVDENIAGLLCYLVGFVTGIIFVLLEQVNRFVRFHAMQSLVTWIVLFIASFILSAIPIIGWAIGLLLSPLYLVLWVVLMWKAYQGEYFKLPVIGDFSEQQIDKAGN